MCRYGMHGYRQHYACFGCRRAFKGVSTCPDCGQNMMAMGLDFKPPRRRDRKQWQKVADLYAAGVGYFGCGCGGPGFRPARLRDVPAFLEARRKARRSDGERFLDDHPRARRGSVLPPVRPARAFNRWDR